MLHCIQQQHCVLRSSRGMRLSQPVTHRCAHTGAVFRNLGVKKMEILDEFLDDLRLTVGSQCVFTTICIS